MGCIANDPSDMRVAVDIRGDTHIVHLDAAKPAGNDIVVGGTRVLFSRGEAWPFRTPTASSAGGAATTDGALLSPMPGRVITLLVQDGDRVTKGQTLLVLAAMKMEQAMTAPFDGAVTKLATTAGAQVGEGIVLLWVVQSDD